MAVLLCAGDPVRRGDLPSAADGREVATQPLQADSPRGRVEVSINNNGITSEYETSFYRWLLSRWPKVARSTKRGKGKETAAVIQRVPVPSQLGFRCGSAGRNKARRHLRSYAAFFGPLLGRVGCMHPHDEWFRAEHLHPVLVSPPGSQEHSATGLSIA